MCDNRVRLELRPELGRCNSGTDCRKLEMSVEKYRMGNDKYLEGRAGRMWALI